MNSPNESSSNSSSSKPFVDPTNLTGFKDFVDKFDIPGASLSSLGLDSSSQSSSNLSSPTSSPVKKKKAPKVRRSKSDENLTKKQMSKRKNLKDFVVDSDEADDSFDSSDELSPSHRPSRQKLKNTRRSTEDLAYKPSLLSPFISDFHRACQLGHITTLESMFRKGEISDVNSVDSLRNTGLHEAALSNHWEIVRCLLKHGASLDVKNLADKTPVDIARTPSMVAFMKEFKMRSIMAKDHKLINLIWNRRAALIPDVLKEERSIDARLDLVNEVDDLGFSPLHAAAIFDRPDAIKMLLKHGAEINSASSLGITPLHDACRFSSPEAMKALLEAGADISKKNKYGHQPFTMCNKPMRRQFRRILKEAGVEEFDVSEPDVIIHFEESSDHSDDSEDDSDGSDGEPEGPFRVPAGGVSREERKLQQMLAIMNKLSPVQKPPVRRESKLRTSGSLDSSMEKLPKDILTRPSERKTAPLDPFFVDKSYGSTNLHKCAAKGSLKDIKTLLKANSKLINKEDNAGYTALHEAALNGHLPVLKYLLEHGADIDHAAINGDTALHDAAENGHLEVTSFLLQAGANRIVKNGRGETAYDSAHPRVRPLLEISERQPTRQQPSTKADEKKRRSKESKETKPSETTQSRKKAKAEVVPASPINLEHLGPLILVRVGEPNGWFFISRQIEMIYCYSKPKSYDAIFKSKHKHLYNNVFTSIQRQHLLSNSIMKRLGELRDHLADFSADVYMLEKDAVYAAFGGLGLTFGNLNVIYLDLQRVLRTSLADFTSPTSNASSSASAVPPKLKMKMQRKGSNPSVLDPSFGSPGQPVVDTSNHTNNSNEAS